MKTLGSAVAKIAAPVLGRRGFGEAQIILEWPAVVGEDLARDSLPVKLSFSRGDRLDGTLHLRVAAGAALEIQHREPVILERINGFFGYRAVGRLAIRQGPLPQRPPPRPPEPRALTPSETATLGHDVAAILDPDLRAAMERLGRAVIAATAKPALQRKRKPSNI
jgi:hypothetical protein